MRCQPSLDVAGERVRLAGQLQAALRPPPSGGLLAMIELDPGETELRFGLGDVQAGAGGQFQAFAKQLLRLLRLLLVEQDIRQPAARRRLKPRLPSLVRKLERLVQTLLGLRRSALAQVKPAGVGQQKCQGIGLADRAGDVNSLL